MATIRSNTFEGGSDETTITTGNSGGASGDAFQQVDAGLTYDSAQAAHGNLSARINVTATEVERVEWENLGSEIEVYGRMYMRRTSTPSEQQRILRWFNAADVEGGRISWHTDAKIYSFDSTLVVPTPSTFTLTAGGWIRFEWRILADPSVGIIEVKAFTYDDTSPIGTYTRTGVNTLTNIDDMGFGSTIASAPGSPFWIDDLALSDTGYLGPAVSPGAADDPPFARLGRGAGW